MLRIVTTTTAAAVALVALYAYRRYKRRKDPIAKILQEADEEQIKMMEEKCIVVDDNDVALRSGSKKECHIMDKIEEGLLHRAFSVFLFNSKGELLLQKRSSAKITFPSYWANTCCSHPLFTRDELETKDALGVKRAARRKIEQELGISPDQLPLECFKFLTRVHYKAHSDGPWGEHEIDHILIARPEKDVTWNLNPNEVEEVRYFGKEELHIWLEQADSQNERISPWFRIIERTLLQKWWDAIRDDMRNGKLLNDEDSSLAEHVEPAKIYRAGDFDKDGSKLA